MKKYDVVVIGGGPAGLMAAGRAAELGASVLLLEKNEILGKKLLMTGGGRCNFTNRLPLRQLAVSFGVGEKFLLSSLNQFGPEEMISFLEARGVKIKVEANGRAFPQSNSANEILQTLINYIKSNGGEIKAGAQVVKIIQRPCPAEPSRRSGIQKLILDDKSEVFADNFVIATGGKSYSLSGSSGEAYIWLKNLGHKIIKPTAALSQIIIKEKLKDLEGLSLTNGILMLYQADKKIITSQGDFIFTARGLSGPTALNLSRNIARLNNGDLKIKIDFFPDEIREDLDRRLQDLIRDNQNMAIKNILGKIIIKRLADFILTELKIKSDKKGGGLTRAERWKILDFLKNYSLSVMGLGDFNEAMVTVGGIDLKEVDPKTMRSKIIKNLYLAGEVLDLDGPTGGYNLQVAWTTGYVAGENVVK
jgi:hypothetical protein